MAACELLVPYGLTLDNLTPLFFSYSVIFLCVFLPLHCVRFWLMLVPPLLSSRAITDNADHPPSLPPRYRGYRYIFHWVI